MRCQAKWERMETVLASTTWVFTELSRLLERIVEDRGQNGTDGMLLNFVAKDHLFLY